MKILVTGGTGYIGTKIVRRLIDRGDNVHVLGFPCEQSFAFPPEQMQLFEGDLLDQPLLDRAMEGCHRVFHLAAWARNWAKDVRTFYEVNVKGTRAVLESAVKNKVERVVCTSTNLTFGPSNGKLVDERTRRDLPFFTPYEHSKFIAERIVREYVRQGLHVVMVNPTRVFGPGALVESNSVTKMIRWYTRGNGGLSWGMEGCRKLCLC